MYALITGASSGIGYEMSKILANKGYDLIIVGRRKEKLIELQNEVKTNCIIFDYDISSVENMKKLYEETKDYEIDILINNAGFGKVGFLSELSVDEGINMVNTNVLALYTLTHLYLNKVKSHILNVGSSAAFTPGPKMANYYATKAYVLSFSRALNYELKKSKSKLRITCLCPGPVKTEFNSVAKGEFKIKGMTKEKCAKKGINGMFKRKTCVYPTFFIKCFAFLSKIIPYRFLEKMAYRIQDRK